MHCDLCPNCAGCRVGHVYCRPCRCSEAVAAERARIAEAVGAMFGQVHPMAAIEDEPTRHDVVSRKAVLAIVEAG